MTTQHGKIQCLATACSILMVCVGSSPSPAATKTWSASTGDWFLDGNWTPATAPVAGDDVVITNASASVILSNSTPWLSSVTLSKTLMFTNWNSALNATNVTILTNGTMTLPGAFTNNATSNNVYIVCSNLTVDAGGNINANAKGYAGGTSDSGGSGSGPGYGRGNYGGGYGGHGSASVGGNTYGSFSAPVDAGSGGGWGSQTYYLGGAGGGAIRIDASGTITNNGTISANGGNGGGTWAGGGSGGGIYLTCKTLSGTTGVFSANGGNPGDSKANGAGGGRIAVIYDTAAQSAVPVPTILFSVACGYDGTGRADIGTLYFPDNRLLTENITHIGQWMVSGITNWSVNNLTLNNAWIRFPVEGFHLTVTNHMTITGGRLEFGSGILKTNYPGGIYSGGSNGPVMDIGGNLILTNSGKLYVYSGMTNAASPNYGALVNVNGDVFVATNCWIYPYSHYINGGSAQFRMNNLTISSSAGFNAESLGYAGGITGVGYGPGGGLFSGAGANGGGGYGGKGGNVNGGNTYGSSNAPVGPGSGGALGATFAPGGNGGGAIRINASGTITNNGTIRAKGRDGPDNWAGAGSGGGIYLTCKTLSGTNSVFSVPGGNVSVSYGPYGGGGGGGRIAVWRAYDTTGGIIQTNVAGGTASSGNGTNGTVVWGGLPDLAVNTNQLTASIMQGGRTNLINFTLWNCGLDTNNLFYYAITNLTQSGTSAWLSVSTTNGILTNIVTQSIIFSNDATELAAGGIYTGAVWMIATNSNSETYGFGPITQTVALALKVEPRPTMNLLPVSFS
ncbi:MAG: hypothetical protein L6455_13305, partial [Kiritimatiellae bacterium]|nr:hypothetical protein [Kiritimatiellia bacterium]